MSRPPHTNIERECGLCQLPLYGNYTLHFINYSASVPYWIFEARHHLRAQFIVVGPLALIGWQVGWPHVYLYDTPGHRHLPLAAPSDQYHW